MKKKAAEEASKLIENGMAVGLGSGTTVWKIVEFVAARKPSAVFVAASRQTEDLARKLGLNLTSLREHPELDIVLDGADEVDPNFNAIKGKGGALTREKILCNCSKRVVFVVDITKLTCKLGRNPVPVEVLPFSLGFVERKLSEFGKPKLRMSGGSPYLTDNQNFIVDVEMKEINQPSRLERRINAIPGVIENGIFPRMAKELVVGCPDGVEVVSTKKKFLELAKSRFPLSSHHSPSF